MQKPWRYPAKQSEQYLRKICSYEDWQQTWEGECVNGTCGLRYFPAPSHGMGPLTMCVNYQYLNREAKTLLFRPLSADFKPILADVFSRY